MGVKFDSEKERGLSTDKARKRCLDTVFALIRDMTGHQAEFSETGTDDAMNAQRCRLVEGLAAMLLSGLVCDETIGHLAGLVTFELSVDTPHPDGVLFELFADCIAQRLGRKASLRDEITQKLDQWEAEGGPITPERWAKIEARRAVDRKLGRVPLAGVTLEDFQGLEQAVDLVAERAKARAQ